MPVKTLNLNYSINKKKIKQLLAAKRAKLFALSGGNDCFATCCNCCGNNCDGVNCNCCGFVAGDTIIATFASDCAAVNGLVLTLVYGVPTIGANTFFAGFQTCSTSAFYAYTLFCESGNVWRGFLEDNSSGNDTTFPGNSINVNCNGSGTAVHTGAIFGAMGEGCPELCESATVTVTFTAGTLSNSLYGQCCTCNHFQDGDTLTATINSDCSGLNGTVVNMTWSVNSFTGNFPVPGGGGIEYQISLVCDGSNHWYSFIWDEGTIDVDFDVFTKSGVASYPAVPFRCTSFGCSGDCTVTITYSP